MIQGLLSVNRERCSGRRSGHPRARRALPKPGRPEDPTVGGPVSTELERFLAADGRDEAVARVRSEIDARGITYIYYQFASVTGRIMGKGVPADHWEQIAGKGFQLVYGSTANLFKIGRASCRERV